MECFQCKGKMVRGNAPYSADRNGYHISWESIPAWVCTQCGEVLFEENEVNHIQKALEKIDHETLALKSSVSQKCTKSLLFKQNNKATHHFSKSTLDHTKVRSIARVSIRLSMVRSNLNGTLCICMLKRTTFASKCAPLDCTHPIGQ